MAGKAEGRKKGKVIGTALVLLAGLAWAIEATIGKISSTRTGFLESATYIGMFALLTSLLLSLVSGKRLKVSKGDFARICFIGLLGSTAAGLLFYYGLSRTYAVNAALIAQLQPVFVGFLGYLFLKERMTKRQVFGAVLIFVAAALVVGRTFGEILSFKIGRSGDLFIFGAMLLWAVVSIPGRAVAKRVDPVVITAYRFLVDVAVMIPVALIVTGRFSPAPIHALIGAVVALGYFAYYGGLSRMSAVSASVLELSSPVFAAAIGLVLLKEAVTFLQVAGIALMVFGMRELSAG